MNRESKTRNCFTEECPINRAYRLNMFVPTKPERRIRRLGCPKCLQHMMDTVKPVSEEEYLRAHMDTTTKTFPERKDNDTSSVTIC